MTDNEFEVNKNQASDGAESQENIGFSNESSVQRIGEIPDELLQRPIKYATGANSKATDNWSTTESTVGQFLSLLTNHRVSKKKDGKSFLQGVSHDGSRKQNAMSEMFMLGLDFDNGETVARLIEKIQAMGVVALIYSTFNHLKGESKVREKAYLAEYAKAGWPKEPTNESLGAFLLKHRKMTPELAATITGFRRDFDGKDGITFFVQHAPLERYRVVFPLEKSFAVATRGGSQQDAIDEWQARYRALSEIIEVEADKTCIDMSRLFYAPRHPEGAPFAVYVVGGERFLDIDSIDLTSVASGGAAAHSADDVFAQNGNDLGGETRGGGKFAEFPQMPSGENWSDWFTTYGKRLKVADLLRERIFPEDHRKDDAGKLTVPCAFEGIHSEVDGPDMGFYAMNPDDSDTGAFLLHCSHNSCQHRPMTDFLHAYIQNAVLSEDDLTDERFLCDSPEDKEYAKLLRQARGFGKLTPHSALNRLLSKLAELDVTPMQRDEVVGVIADKLKQSRKKIESALDKLTAKANAVKAAKQENEERLAVNAAAVNGGDEKPELMLGRDGFDYQVATSWGRLSALNRISPKYFEMGGVQKVRLSEPDEEGRILSEAFDAKSMVSELNVNVRWVKPRGDADSIVVSADPHVAEQILNQSDLHFPRLDGFAHSPFFTREGELVSVPGYHAASRTYYSPPSDFVLPDIPEHPTLADVKAARALIEDNLLVDFPWSDGGDEGDTGKSSKAHAMALLLEPFMRPMIPDLTPAYFVNKPMAGTGASLLIQSVARVATGSEVGAQTETKNDDEQRKSITAFLLSGAPVFFLDNVNAHLHGSAYANLITCGVWEDRQLGASKKVRLPVRCSFVFAGNNVAMSKEIARRCLPIMLDAQRDPTDRLLFKHNLKQWVPANRAALVAACLTLIKYWVAEDQPKWNGKPLASFEAYCQIMGGLLEAIGVEGFCGNFDLTANASSSEDEAYAELFSKWFDEFGEVPRLIGNPFVGNGSGERGEYDGENSILHLIEANGFAIPIGEGDARQKAQKLGMLLHHRNGRVFKREGLSLRLIGGGKRGQNKQKWAVEAVRLNPFVQAAEDLLKFADAVE